MSRNEVTKRLPVQLAAAGILGRPKAARRNEKLNLQLNQRVTVPYTMQRIEFTCFPDRHFWHGGYDKAELLSERLRTALPIEMHLALAFEQAFRLGERRVSVEVVEQVLSRAIDDLEPTLTRKGYDASALTGLLNAKPAEIRDFLAGTLNTDRTREFTEQLRVAGVPV